MAGELVTELNLYEETDGASGRRLRVSPLTGLSLTSVSSKLICSHAQFPAVKISKMAQLGSFGPSWMLF